MSSRGQNQGWWEGIVIGTESLCSTTDFCGDWKNPAVEQTILWGSGALPGKVSTHSFSGHLLTMDFGKASWIHPRVSQTWVEVSVLPLFHIMLPSDYAVAQCSHL
jgi:hypothetical protein